MVGARRGDPGGDGAVAVLRRAFAFAEGRWHVSDRGPLQPLLLLWGGHWSTSPVAAYAPGIVVNSAWVVGLWCLLRALEVSEDRIRWAVLLTALTGVIWVNTVYPWPKLLAGALALGCAAAILERRLVLASVLAGLAMLAHSTALFALVALVPWAISRFGKRALVGLAIAGAVYAPWFAYGRFVDPPADRLIKFHFAGTDIFWPDERGPVEAIVREYRSRHGGGRLQDRQRPVRARRPVDLARSRRYLDSPSA